MIFFSSEELLPLTFVFDSYAIHIFPGISGAVSSDHVVEALITLSETFSTVTYTIIHPIVFTHFKAVLIMYKIIAKGILLNHILDLQHWVAYLPFCKHIPVH